VQKAVVLAPGTVFMDDLVPPTVRTYSENLPQASRLATAAPQPSPDETLQAALDRYADLSGPDINKLFQQAERILITYALNKERGVKLRAARVLGINRVTLDRKLLEYHIHVKRGRGVVATPGGEGDEDAEEEEGPAHLTAV